MRNTPMTLAIPFQRINAFAASPFAGNPAAVCDITGLNLSDDMLQRIATENNVSETSFIQQHAPDHYHIRWFTPVKEVALCGHATLAAAHFVASTSSTTLTSLTFDSQSGALPVHIHAESTPPCYTLDFPAYPLQHFNMLEPAVSATLLHSFFLNSFSADVLQHVRILQGEHMCIVLPDAFDLSTLRPNLQAIAAYAQTHHVVCTIITARSSSLLASTLIFSADTDVVCRVFAPNMGIDEDPATGSIHCLIAPFWQQYIPKSTLRSVQLSPRRGHIQCTLHHNRVLLTGSAHTIVHGQFLLTTQE